MFGRKGRFGAPEAGVQAATAPTRRRFPWKWGVGAGVFVFVLLGAGLALATVPNGNTINACRNNTTFAIRVLDKSVTPTQNCTASETAFSWTSWKWRGNYVAATKYNLGDVVFYRASSYLVT